MRKDKIVILFYVALIMMLAANIMQSMRTLSLWSAITILTITFLWLAIKRLLLSTINTTKKQKNIRYSAIAVIAVVIMGLAIHLQPTIDMAIAMIFIFYMIYEEYCDRIFSEKLLRRPN